MAILVFTSSEEFNNLSTNSMFSFGCFIFGAKKNVAILECIDAFLKIKRTILHEPNPHRHIELLMVAAR